MFRINPVSQQISTENVPQAISPLCVYVKNYYLSVYILIFIGCIIVYYLKRLPRDFLLLFIKGTSNIFCCILLIILYLRGIIIGAISST